MTKTKRLAKASLPLLGASVIGAIAGYLMGTDPMWGAWGAVFGYALGAEGDT